MSVVVTVAERGRVLEEMVRDWAAPEFGCEPWAIDRAVTVAEQELHGGESVLESWRSACRFLQSWSQHPSHVGLFHMDRSA